MSTKRYARVGDAFPSRPQPDGSYLCSVCGKPIEGNGTRYCKGAACRDKAYIATSPSFARFHVHLRDKGVCANCDCDTDKIERILKWASHWYQAGGPWSRYMESVIRNEYRSMMGFKTRHLWEMDHTEPVVEGGGLCGLENLRTLCVPCHRLDTAELAARRAEMRREMPLFRKGT